MLKRTHVAPFLAFNDGSVSVRFLQDDRSHRVTAFLDWMLRLTHRLEGRPMSVVREALRRQTRRVRDARRLDGIAKTILDRSRIEPPPGAGQAAGIRQAVFAARSRCWPPLPEDRHRPYEAAAATLDIAADCLPELLYADRPEARLLVRAPRLTAAALLDRYNLELVKALLLDATAMTVAAQGGWRRIFRAVKLARLMYEIEPRGRGYRVTLTGPAARHVARPGRYGIRFARVITELVKAPRWRLEATIVHHEHASTFRLDGRAPVGKGPAGTRFDSEWERSLAKDFAQKLGAERKRWTLKRENTPVATGGELFLPDFTLRHTDGRVALVELIGYWTPEYLTEKLRKLAAAGLDNLIVVAYSALAVGTVVEALEASAGRVLWFKEKPRIAPVLDAAEKIAARPD